MDKNNDVTREDMEDYIKNSVLVFANYVDTLKPKSYGIGGTIKTDKGFWEYKIQKIR